MVIISRAEKTHVLNLCGNQKDVSFYFSIVITLARKRGKRKKSIPTMACEIEGAFVNREQKLCVCVGGERRDR